MNKKIDFSQNKNVEIELLNVKEAHLPKLVNAQNLSEMELPEITWIVKDLIPVGLNMLAGKPKEGKSIMGMNISLAVAQGVKAFGYFDVEKHGVLYLCYEDSLQRLKRRLNKMKKIDYLDTLPENLYFPMEPYDFPVLDEKGIQIIKGYLKSYKEIKLVVVDTLGRGVDPKVYAKGTNYNSEYGYNSMLHRFAQKNEIAMLIIHHTRKASAENDLDEILGTNGVAGSMDNLYTLKKVNGNYVFHTQGRDIEGKEFRMKQSKESLSWVIEGERHGLELTEEKKEIVDLLTIENKVMKTGSIAKDLGKKTSNISKHLKVLYQEGIIYLHGFGEYAIFPKEHNAGKGGKSSKSDLKLLNLEETDETEG